MPLLAVNTLAALLIALATAHAGMPALHVHIALAVGLLPLMFGAMLHFAPVLTRSGAPSAGIGKLPWVVWLGGILAASAFAVPQWFVTGRFVAAVVALGATVTLLVWMTRRARAALGAPHPCLDWYRAALACFALALVAVLAMGIWPEWTLALKRLHLHLNLLGLVGLTALGTLQVLLPTALAQPDPGAGIRLRKTLPWAVGATLLVASGAAWRNELAWLGGLLWLALLALLLRDWLTRYGNRLLDRHGAAPSLASAAVGFTLGMALGPWHGSAGIQPTNAAHAFVAMFLLPLVSGALSQLLPLWLRPGRQDAWHENLRTALGRWGGLRAALFCTGGLGGLAGWSWGWAAVAGGMALFLAQLPAILTIK